MRRQAGAGPQGPAAMLSMLERLAALEPSHTRRSEEQIRLQQFSTPLPLAYAAAQAAMIRPADRVLEPSAGTGMLAVMAYCALRENATLRLYLNELAPTRAGLLEHLFPRVSVNRNNAENIADYLLGLVPSAVLMNPPFSASPGVERRRNDADLRHIRSAFSMLPPGGRLVAITSHSCIPGNRAWQSAFRYLDPPARTVFSMGIDGRAYARHGTSFDTRLTVLDRMESGEDPGPPSTPRSIPPRPRPMPPNCSMPCGRSCRRARPWPGCPPPREARAASCSNRHPARPGGRRRSHKPAPRTDWGPVAELEYEIPDPAGASSQPGADDTAATQSPAGPYEPWRPSAVRIEGARPHPTALVQSAAMAAVAHPRPAYRPKLPARIVSEGRLSDAQLESVILAGQAHERRLPAHFRIGDGWETVNRVSAAHGNPADSNPAEDLRHNPAEAGPYAQRMARCFRLPSGSAAAGCSATAPAAARAGRSPAIILDRWLRGTRRALWLSASDKLLEDARRDWAALGGAEADVVPLGKIRPADPIPHRQGILFATYAALRSPARQGSQSRLKQIVHGWPTVSMRKNAMRSPASSCSTRPTRWPMRPARRDRAAMSLPPGRAARGCACRTRCRTPAFCTCPPPAPRRWRDWPTPSASGLWGTDETPFERRTDFVSAMESGGVAAMEVVARDLKALGLYQARALSYDGVEVELLEHPLTDEQRRIYDSYADAFKIIHSHLEQALQSTGISRRESARSTATPSPRPCPRSRAPSSAFSGTC